MNCKKLANGYELPDICYGTGIVSSEYFAEKKSEQALKRIKSWCKHVVKIVLGRDARNYKFDYGVIKCCNAAVRMGCCFFDTSRAYSGSETMLGQALSSEKREDFFICTKIDNRTQLNNIPARETLLKSMKELNVDYVDVLLLHWPVEGKYLNYWKQLEELYNEGLVKAIGVSNCKIHHLEEIKKVAEIMPMINEVELHPLLSEVELRKYCNQNNIQIMAYTSSARLDFRLKSSKRLKAVCSKYNKSLSQIILRWHIQNGVIPIFNTSNIEHFKSNMDVYDFELDEEAVRIIDSININSRTRYDSDNCEWECL